MLQVQNYVWVRPFQETHVNKNWFSQHFSDWVIGGAVEGAESCHICKQECSLSSPNTKTCYIHVCTAPTFCTSLCVTLSTAESEFNSQRSCSCDRQWWRNRIHLQHQSLHSCARISTLEQQPVGTKPTIYRPIRDLHASVKLIKRSKNCAGGRGVILHLTHLIVLRTNI